MRKNTLCITAFATFFALSLNASAAFLDFAGWDHSQIANGGQSFTDICGDLDVFVESIGAFESDSTFLMTMAGGDAAIRSQKTGLGGHSFKFTFSEPIDVYVEFGRLDSEEMLGVYGIGPETYNHLSGNLPGQAIDGSGLKVSGNGFGTAAADGQVSSGPTSVLTVGYTSMVDGPTKYLDFNIGKVAVPEPGAFSLLGMAALACLQFVRRRR